MRVVGMEMRRVRMAVRRGLPRMFLILLAVIG